MDSDQTVSVDQVGDRAVRSGHAQVCAGILLGFAVGIVLIGLGNLRAIAPPLSGVLEEAGKVVLVSSVIGVIFEFYMHKRFVGLVEKQVKSVGKQVDLLDHSVYRLQTTVTFTSGAIESGLTAVYGERHQAIDEIGKLLENAKPGEELRLLGISLGDFLCPHGRLYGATADALKKGVNVRALLVDMYSEAAKTRAWMEEGKDTDDSLQATPEDPEWMKWYQTTRCFDELKTATDVAQRYKAKFKIADQRRGQFCYFAYHLSPLCFLAVHQKTMFLESYHYAARGGEAPILRINQETPGSPQRSGRLFDIYSSHFETLWRISEAEAKEANLGAASGRS